jgi:transposase
MLFVSPVNALEFKCLQEMVKNHPLPWTRIRANAVLLSDNKTPLQNIAKIYGVCRQTTATWLKNWEKSGIFGLVDKPGRGRHKILSPEKEEKVVEITTSSPRSLNQVLAEIQKRWEVKISRSTLKRTCKKIGLSWKRVRKSLRGKRDDEKFAATLVELKVLMHQADKGEIDFYYFDESGFTLEPCVPYAWQPVGEHIEIPSSKSKRLNVLGFIDRSCNFESFVFEGSVTSEVVVACFDQFAQKITKKTAVVIDNASMHTCNNFRKNIEKWEKQGLFIQNIPAYSPELNKIEILWRKIKYEWLDFSAYESFNALKNALYDILANVGQDYHINFT